MQFALECVVGIFISQLDRINDVIQVFQRLGDLGRIGLTVGQIGDLGFRLGQAGFQRFDDQILRFVRIVDDVLQFRLECRVGIDVVILGRVEHAQCCAQVGNRLVKGFEVGLCSLGVEQVRQVIYGALQCRDGGVDRIRVGLSCQCGVERVDAVLQIILRVLQRADVIGSLPHGRQDEVVGNNVGVEIKFLVAVVPAEELVSRLFGIDGFYDLTAARDDLPCIDILIENEFHEFSGNRAVIFFQRPVYDRGIGCGIVFQHRPTVYIAAGYRAAFHDEGTVVEHAAACVVGGYRASGDGAALHGEGTGVAHTATSIAAPAAGDLAGSGCGGVFEREVRAGHDRNDSALVLAFVFQRIAVQVEGDRAADREGRGNGHILHQHERAAACRRRGKSRCAIDIAGVVHLHIARAAELEGVGQVFLGNVNSCRAVDAVLAAPKDQRPVDNDAAGGHGLDKSCP